MNIQAAYKITIHNRDTYCGCYDGGDDWEVEGYGSTIYNAILNAFETCEEHSLGELVPYHSYISKVNYVIANKERFYSLKEEDVNVNLQNDKIMSMKKSHPRYIEIKEKEALKNKRLEEHQQKLNEEKELKAYKELKAKFEGQ